MKDQLLVLGFEFRGDYLELVNGKMAVTGQLFRCNHCSNLHSDDYDFMTVIVKGNQLFKLEIDEREDEHIIPYSIEEIKEGFEYGFLF